MKKASIVSVGNELLSGQIIDTNASYLGGKLLSIGIPIVSSYTIGDDTDSIIRILELAGSDSDIVLLTGGLGPTDDDITRQAFAKFLDVELQLESELLKRIQDFFDKRDLRMPEKAKVQAYIPVGTKTLVNNLGTAVGIRVESKGKLFFALPGVPSEMKQMFEEEVLPELARVAVGQAIVIRELRCFKGDEPSIAEKLGELMQRDRNPLINCTAQCGVITLTIIATAEDKGKAQQMAERDEKTLRNILGELIYGTGKQTLAEVVGAELAQRKKTIAVAESCTGGTLAKLLTDIPGASVYFTYGWVTYSNAAKISELGVEAGLIEKHGTVSARIAEAMAQGARRRAGTDFAIGITGIAGPAGGNEQKPVGLVYISVASDNKCETKRFIFAHNREVIRLQASQTALNMLRLKLLQS